MATEPKARWVDVVEPVARRFRLAAHLDMQICWRGDGARSVANLLTRMAQALDQAVDLQIAAPPCVTQTTGTLQFNAPWRARLFVRATTLLARWLGGRVARDDR